MTIQRNMLIEGSKQKPILLDRYFHDEARPLVIFSHGFKGFKDWGHFNQMADFIFSKGFHFVKFNFSYNGTTPKHPVDFVDLEAFANNNFSIELNDLGLVIDDSVTALGSRCEDVCLIGHSRGGGITLLKAAEDSRVKKIATWASVHEYGRLWNEETISAWKEKGKIEVFNGRTHQHMPLYYQMYDDYCANQDRLHIPSLVPKINIPGLIVHAKDDPTVPVAFASELVSWNQNFELRLLESGAHTFDGKHPWEEPALPANSLKVCEETIRFFAS